MQRHCGDLYSQAIDLGAGDIDAVDLFEDVERELIAWTVIVKPADTVALFGVAPSVAKVKERLTKLSDGKCDLDDVAAIIERVVAVSVMALTGGGVPSKVPARPVAPYGRLTRQDL